MPDRLDREDRSAFRRVKDWLWSLRWRRALERVFLLATLVTLCFAVYVVAWLGLPLFDSPKLVNGDERFRLDVVWRVSVFLGALVTAFSVLWRGTIASRHADSQRDAIDRQTDQIKETRLQRLASEEKQNLEDLRISANLLNSESKTDIEIAIRVLQRIIVAPETRYWQIAMDLLADKMQSIGISDNTYAMKYMYSAMESGAKIGRTSMKSLAFGTTHPDARWHPIAGVWHITFEGGIVTFPQSFLACKSLPTLALRSSCIEVMTDIPTTRYESMPAISNAFREKFVAGEFPNTLRFDFRDTDDLYWIDFAANGDETLLIIQEPSR
ncbi:hypothetical protein E3C22_18065 [Jiella endophytica]|uniref:Uncharacterized protein n=1 Tax=Jiella endophytica TaxID=2558362 RepID=A0A4Y8RER5_9HYPH|nr:hypothetical protein [Jiella endophytica]TFF20795.1 hypothetical protein E3C22_18065 [Jiella endophytica]